MISEHDRTNMRKEAERVLERNPNTFADSHLMGVFVVTLLDHLEGAKKPDETPETVWVTEDGSGEHVGPHCPHCGSWRDE